MTSGLFSVIVALYEVEDYVGTFLQSLERQSYPFRHLDVVVVDDGSSDRSYEIVKEWVDKYPDVIRLYSKPNGGPASARNVGLDVAKNKWITFCDPDDALQSNYFQNVEKFLNRDGSGSASMLTTKVMLWQEETSKISDTHPLALKYFMGEKLVDLNVEPNYIQLGGASTFLQSSTIRTHNLRFDERIRPTFEDAELIGRYLGTFERPVVGLVSSARYLYRKRGDGSSLVQSSWAQNERYDDVLRYGFLGLLKGLKERMGYVPVWAQNMVLYDLQWYLTEDKKMHSASSWLPKANLDVFHDLLTRIFAYIDADTIEKYNLTSMSWLTRNALLVHFKGRGFRLHSVVNWSGKSSGDLKLGYAFSGSQPDEHFEVDGRVVEASRTKTTAHSYFGKVLFYERTVWLPNNGSVAAWLDGLPAEIGSAKVPAWDRSVPSPPSLRLLPASSPASLGGRLQNLVPILGNIPAISPALSRLESMARKLDNRIGIERLVSNSGSMGAVFNIARRIALRKLQTRQSARSIAADKALVAWATSPAQAEKYGGAWLIMDRPDKADDNGEHLYRYILRNRPDIKAWFVLSSRSADWKRLSDEGFSLIDVVSKEAIPLSLNASFKISSDATIDVQFPVSPKRFGKGCGKIVFLQHGVTKDDLSRWLNPKPISLIITATLPEYHSIAGDDSPYRYTASETKLTGFPRYDELLRKSAMHKASGRPYLLVMPTWRQDLKTAIDSCNTDYERLSVFESSEYGKSWLELLRSEQLADFAKREKLEVLYAFHPSMANFMDGLRVPAHVRTFRPEDCSLQDVFAQTSVAITDYSSIAFDIAMVGGAILYYQFDANKIFDGRHNYRKGYYDYYTDGFGPVAHSLSEMSVFYKELSELRLQRPHVYSERVRSTFAFMDTDNCKRVVDAIGEL